MRLDTFAICYNEEVLLPHFIRYYKQFGEVTIYDNQSTDSSPQIIKDLGANLITYDSGNEIRDDIYLAIKNNCWKKSTANWVIVCDIDEFYYSKKGLLNELESIKESIVKPTGFDMYSNDELLFDDDIFTKINKGVPIGFGKLGGLFRPDRIKEINYTVGAHNCNPIGDITINDNNNVLFLHYKHINLDYVKNKHEQYYNRLSLINKKNNWGYHYKVNEDFDKNFITNLNNSEKII